MLSLRRCWQAALGVLVVVHVGQALAECTSNRNTNIAITRPDSRYTDNLDGTVTDKGTGLMWQKCSLGQTWNAGSNVNSGEDDSCDGTETTLDWQAALNAANGDTGYGYSDWYLPNKNELASLVDLACFSPSINESIFPATVSLHYWTSSPYTDTDSHAVFVRFDSGAFGQYMKSATYPVRLVRSIE